MLTCKTPWRSLRQLDETRWRIKKFYNYCSQRAARCFSLKLEKTIFFNCLKKLFKKLMKKFDKRQNQSHSCQRWNKGMAPVSDFPTEPTKRV